ncbi:thermonuclease family protein [Desulfogranum marinum]|uniref:thermonuclease family protein n=1 Tax=Desulfogranum marinum TaxID=453220 RepID=UPI001964A6F0|nr:hypothetical protein [Desulfogranum marinum]MBM9515006.1 hypothetical protein [Desulfogranum marinum]
MSKRAVFPLLIGLLFLLPLPAFAWTGKVIGVAGGRGDTIKVQHGNQQVKIRLYGIDTPEKKQAYGNQAKS